MLLLEINWTPILGGASVGIVVSAVTGYLLAARKMSGKIGTSDADKLWLEAGEIRDDYRRRLIQADERALNLEMRMANVEGRNNELEAKTQQLNNELEACKRVGERMRARIAELEAQPKGAT